MKTIIVVGVIALVLLPEIQKIARAQAIGQVVDHAASAASDILGAFGKLVKPASRNTASDTTDAGRAGSEMGSQWGGIFSAGRAAVMQGTGSDAPSPVRLF